MAFLSDLRFGVRMLARTPGATLTVLLALSLGVGLSIVTFTMIDGAVLTHLPGEGGDRVVRISRGDEARTTGRDYAAWVARQRTFDGIGAVETSTVTVSVEGWAAEPARSVSLTPSVLPLLSTAPVLGRMFTDSDAAPDAPAVVLVSHDLWRDRMDADPRALGSVIRVNGRPAEVVGVMPEGFGFPWDSRVWSPLAVDPLRDADAEFVLGESRLVVGRVREGVSPGSAAEELAVLSREVDAQRLGATGAEATVAVRNFTDLFGDPGGSRALALLTLGIALMVLLVACANVASVLLARAIDRAREVAVRVAMGATRVRVVTQLLAEVSLLAFTGAAGGVALAFLGTRWVETLFPPGMPYWIELRVDGGALFFAALVAVIAALAAGLLPAIQASRTDTHTLLKDNTRGNSGRRGGRLMGRLVVLEMAVSFVLLALSGLFIKSGLNLRTMDHAFAPESVLMANAGIPASRFASEAELVQVAGQLLSAVEALPQVSGVALATAPPGIGSSPRSRIEVDGVPAGSGAGPQGRQIVVSPGYFQLFHGAPLEGRDFDGRDLPGAERVAIVNRAFAARYFPDGGAVDRRIRMEGGPAAGEWLTVVGVVPDLLAGGIEEQVPEAVYLPYAQHPTPAPTVLARAGGDPAALGAPVRDALRAFDPEVAVFGIRTLDDAMSAANSSSRWMSILFLVSGGIALLLATVGLYGVMAFWVIQRTREIGVRMAVGGRRGDIVRLVLGQGLRHTGLGLGAGVLLALPIARLLAFALHGVPPYDPLVFAGTAGILMGVALLGCLVPTRRATRLEPVEALISE